MNDEILALADAMNDLHIREMTFPELIATIATSTSD
jgi:hypothetical protein